MSATLVKTDGRFTYQDYLLWPDDERWEIIDGRAYNMTPAPTTRHQRISMGIIEKLILEKKNLKNCALFFAPTDVVLDEYNVVQPDIFIVCDRKKITERNIQGAPDLIVEITSPSTEIKDRREKLRLYESHGVREYVIVFPEREYVERYFLDEGKYSAPEIFNWDEELKLKIFDMVIPLWDVFEKELPEKESEDTDRKATQRNG